MPKGGEGRGENVRSGLNCDTRCPSDWVKLEWRQKAGTRLLARAAAVW